MNLSVVFMPHPPIIIPKVGNGQEIEAQKTIDAMEEVSQLIGKMKPDTIIFTTPHGNSFSNGSCVLYEKLVKGDFSVYGAKEVKFEKKVNLDLSQKIYEELEKQGFISILMNRPVAEMYGVDIELDNGAMVASHYIDQYYEDYNIVHITPGSTTSLKENYMLGKCIRNVVKSASEKVLLLCSGDLSHALKSEGPYNFHPSGPIFDKKVKGAIEKGDPIKLLTLEDDFIEEAAQCGLRSFLMGFGYMDSIGYSSKVVSYEGPFGVGYLTGYFTEDGEAEQSLLGKIENIELADYERKISTEDDYIKLARKSIERYVDYQRKLNFEDVKDEFSEEFIEKASVQRAGVFVTIYSNGSLRGCIGTIDPTKENIIEEIIHNGISACSFDRRFAPVEARELTELDISVDVLMEPELIDTKGKLDVKKYGVIVSKGEKQGLLLPNLEGVNTVDQQVSIAMEKAAISNEKDMDLYRFEVIRHER